MKFRIKIVKSTEKIPGGLGAKLTGTMEEKHQQIADEHGVSVEEIEAELEKGMEVEMEHTTDEDMAHEIAMDHLLEDPKYYTNLSKIEEKKGKKRKAAQKKRRQKKKKGKKKDACYRKVKSRYDVWPSAYASGALVKCRKVGAKNWGNKSKKKNEELELQEKTDGKKSGDSNYSLKDWFDDGGWVQAGGKYDGKPCAKQPGQKTKPYCRDPDNRKALSKKERDKRAAKKRKNDPNPDRKGKAKNVSQKDGRKK